MVLLPLYRMSVSFHMADTLPGLFLPMAAVGISFWTMIYRSFFRSLPFELAEASRIDGAGHPGTFFRIMLPLAGPATVLAVLLVFIGAWSDYLLEQRTCTRAHEARIRKPAGRTLAHEIADARTCMPARDSLH